MVQAVIEEKSVKAAAFKVLLLLRCKKILICFKAILSPHDIHVRSSDAWGSFWSNLVLYNS